MLHLDSDEKILLTARKHWFILVSEAFFIMLLVALPFAIFEAWRSLNLQDFIPLEGGLSYLASALFSTWLLFLWLAFFVVWTDYYLDILILTNKRVIDIEQKGLFSREVATLRIERIQDITTEVHGVIPTLLDFGNLHIQTAGREREFVVKGIARPNRVKEKILGEHNKSSGIRH